MRNLRTLLAWSRFEPPRVLGAARDQNGFTLIELLVVILIIGILAAIAIPVLLGQRQKAEDASAKSAVRQAHSAAEVYAIDHANSYASMTDRDLKAIEPSLNEASDLSVDSATASSYEVSVKNTSGTRTFSISKTATTLRRSCTPEAGGCRTTAPGVNGW